MPRALLVLVHEDLVGALGCDEVVRVRSDDEAFERVRQEAADLDAIVLGPDCRAPIQIAQRAHAADPDLGILVLSDDRQYDEIAAAIKLAPLIGDGVSCVRIEPRAPLAGELAAVLARTQVRRTHRCTIAALNERIAPAAAPLQRARSEAYFAQIVDHAPIGIVVLEGRGRVVGWNRAADTLWGRSEREMLGESLEPLFADDEQDRLRAFLRRGSDPGPQQRETFRASGTAGPVNVEITHTRVADDDGTRTLVLLQDVTMRELAQQRAEEASRAKDEFLAVVSHELRTPLTAILGWSRILAPATRTPEQIERGLASIERNAAAQLRIVEDLLDMSRIIAGKMILSLAPVDLVTVARVALDAVVAAAADKGVIIDFSAAGPVLVLGDAERLQQVLWNLLGNAIKFTPRGRRIVLHVGCAGEGTAGVVVRDTGAGISPEFLPHVFDRFRQADASTTRAHRGLGLGLAIVQHIIEQHGGSVRAESEGLDRGATFTITLPRLGDDLERGTRVPEDRGAGATRLDGVRLLVVEDDADTRDLLVTALGERGAEVAAAGSVAEAMAALALGSPDALVSDLAMPGEDGYALLRRVRVLPGRAGRVPALALSAHTGRAARDRALAAGFQVHLEKPVEVSALAETIAALLRAAAR
jgi:PAS domain S-box-containing protein